jgi:hypothetical protein
MSNFKCAATAVTNCVGNKKRAKVAIKLPDLVASITELSWTSGIRAAREKVAIAAPHWKEGENVNEADKADEQKFPTGSKRPAVYLVKSKGGANTMSVKIKVTKSKGQSANGVLSAKLGTLDFSGNCPTSVGEHVVTLKIDSLPNKLAHFEGDMTWSLKTPEADVVLSNRPRAELFVVLDKPEAFYAEGAWTEALRFLFKNASVGGIADAQHATAKITTYCHTGHGMKYDTSLGAARFSGGKAIRGGLFNLMHYIRKLPVDPYVDDGVTVNCYDQAAAVQSLAGVLGVKIGSGYQKPFGFIKTTNLIGVGRCNNPFYRTNGSTKEVPADSPLRIDFNNHAFASLGGKIYDACAGPHIGTENTRQYLEASIDAQRTMIKLGLAGTPTAFYDYLHSKFIMNPGVLRVA